MENQRNSIVPKLKSLDGVISPINVPNFAGGRRFHHSPLSPIFDPYASDSSSSPSPLMKYLCSAAPAVGTTGPSSPVFTTPLKVEEDVIVMDGIPVPKSNKGGRARTKSTLTSLTLTSSSSSRPGGAGAENNNSNKLEICRRWEDSGICRFGSKCQFAHGKEELRPPRLFGKNKLEHMISCMFSDSCDFLANRSSNSTTVPVDQPHHHMAGKAVQLTKSSPPPPQQLSHCRRHPYLWPHPPNSNPIMDPSMIAKSQVMPF